MKRSGLAIVLLGCAVTSAAQEPPFVRVELTPAEVAVGEPVELRVTVLGPTWFPEPPVFPSFEIANAVVRLPPNRSRPTSERVGRETWTGVVRNYEIHPLTSARYRLDGLEARVTYADPVDRRPVVVDIAVPPIEFRATVPAGAESVDPYLAGRALTLTREIDGDPESLTAGDALVVRYTAELDGMPALFLPPLVATGETPGLSTYAAEPVIEDGTPARRSEQLTYVFETGGDFEIPAAALRWWNTATSSVETAAIEPLTIQVAGPTAATPSPDPLAERGWLPAIVKVLVLIVALGTTAGATASLASRWRRFRERRLVSEAYAFRRLRQALRSGDLRRAYPALLNWRRRFTAETGLDDSLLTAHDSALREQLELLGRALYTDSGDDVNSKQLARLLTTERSRLARTAGRQHSASLPPLNP